MGWLREFMSQSGQRSFGELARQALAHPDWPEDTKAQPRSLETILGRLDRREEIEWLADRPGVQQVLADVLRITVAEVRTILLSGADQRPATNRLRLDDIRVARSLELPHEALPPGIPDRVCLPATWTRCCWYGQHGSGFGLAAQWLGARGLAMVRAIETEEELKSIPQAGPPLYLELPLEMLASWGSGWTGVQPLCLAIAGQIDREQISAALPGFELLSSAPARDCLDQLLDWALFRVADRPLVPRQTLLEWLRRGPISWGILETLGDALGLIGICLDGVIDPSMCQTEEALLRRWMKTRTAELARERQRDVAQLRSMLSEVLVDFAQSVLIDDSRPILAARSIEEWLALVPEQHRRGPDLDWLTTRLVTDNLPMRKLDLERAAKALPPGAHRIVVALRELGILRPTSVTKFALRPHFVARLVHSIGKARITESAPVFWGEGLLRPAARPELLATLQHRACRQPETLAEDVLEQIDLDNPALVSAFESTFVAMGLGLLTGVELGEHTAASLLKEQAALLLTDVAELPCPRLLPSLSRDLLDLPGTFFVAAWALSEQARCPGTSLHPALDPWRTSQPPANWSALLDCVAESIRVALSAPPPWFGGALRMLDRIRQTIGSQTEPNGQPHSLFLAGALLDAAELGVLEWPTIEELLPHDWQLQLLRATAELRGVGSQRLLESVIAAWWEAARPASGYLLLARWAPDVFRFAPPELLGRLLADPALAFPPEAARELSPAALQAWLEARKTIALESETELPWRLAPIAVLEQALVSRAPEREAIYVTVWSRAPELALRQVEQNRAIAPKSAARWLRIAPLAQVPTIAQYALRNAWKTAADDLTGELLRLMHRAVAARIPDWHVAYDCLNQLDHQRRRFA